MTNICIHHWIIEIPNGSTSTGICKLCNETRLFANAWGEGVWSTNRSATTRTLSPDEVGLELAR